MTLFRCPDFVVVGTSMGTVPWHIWYEHKYLHPSY